MLLLNVFNESIASIGIWLVSGIYHVAAWSFELFLLLSKGQIIETSSYSGLIKNFYVILGIVMLFFLAFILLKSMINSEDDKGTTTIRKVIINLITSLIILVLLPTIFEFLFDFQKSVIVNQNTIGRFFSFGGSITNTTDNNFQRIRQGAFQITNGVFTAFFNADSEYCEQFAGISECQESIKSNDNKTDLKNAINIVEKNGQFSNNYSNFTKAFVDKKINFNFLFSLIAGAILAYVAISFAIDMALRLVKLVFYQLIAPIPLFARVIPDTKLSGTFNQWLKVTLTCYLEVYVRIFALFFAVYLFEVFRDNHIIDNLLNEYGGNIITFLAKAFVYMGLIMFMRQIPKLLADVTGLDSSNMKLGIKDKLKDAGVFAAGAAIGGGLTALTRNAVNAGQNIKNKWKDTKGFMGKAGLITQGLRSTVAGGVSGTVRSAKAGWKAGSAADMRSAAGAGSKAAVDARDLRESYRAKHGDTLGGVIKGHIIDTLETGQRWAGINNIEEYQQSISSMDNVNSKVDAVADEARKVLASNAKTGKTFTYGLDGVINDSIKDASKNPDYQGIEMVYSLNNYRALENAIQRAQDSGGAAELRVETSKKGVYETRKFTIDVLNRLQNQYVTDYSEAIANQAFKSAEKYKAWAEDIQKRGDYKEVAAMSAIRAKAEDARNEMARVLNSEAVKRANEAAYKYHYQTIYNDLVAKGLSDVDAKRQAEIDVGKILLNAQTINGDLKITDRTALNYYGSAAKEVKSEYQTEISKIQQKEKDKNGK